MMERRRRLILRGRKTDLPYYEGARVPIERNESYMDKRDISETEALRYYKEAYRREQKRGRALSKKLAEAERSETEAVGKLARIKGSLLWRLSKPLRMLVHKMQRTKERLGYYGSLKGVLKKLNAKAIEKKPEYSTGQPAFRDLRRRRDSALPSSKKR